MKRVFGFFVAAVLVLTASLPVVSAEYNSEIKKDLYSPIYMLVSLDDGTVIFNKNENKKCAPATFVKIVTAITVIESCSDLDQILTVDAKALDMQGYEYGMITSELSAGEKMTVRQLLYCCMLQSANDACNVLAWHFGAGKPEDFIKKMNDEVEKIGCESTVIKNATGLDADGQVTTAADMVKIVTYGLTLPVFKEIFSAKSIELPATNTHSAREYYTGNIMAFSSNGEYYYEYSTGGKYGSTDKAGRVFAVTAARDGYTYLAVVMKGERKAIEEDGEIKNCAVLDAQTMFRWVFSNIKLKTVASTSQVVTVIDVKSGKDTDHVRLVPETDVTALVPAKADQSSVLIEPIEGSVKEYATAPVVRGEVLGQAKILYADKEIAKVNLVAAESVQRSTARFIGNVFGAVFSSTAFKIVFGLVLFLIAAFILLTAYGNIKERRRKKRKKNRKS